jgi:RimJ/RimL family protein N-acetyltransferase
MRGAMTPPDFDPRPVVLEGRHVRLEPLTREHLDPLLAVGDDPAIWRWMPHDYFCDRDLARAWIEEAVTEMEAGRAVVFATCHRDDGPVGCTRFFDIARPHRSLEIGWTWIAPPWQRSPVNTEAKLLMLGHAFDDLGALRVQLKTDSRNDKSRRAMERVGCRFEGVARNHMLLPDGSHRHSAFYSVIADEWPQVKAGLQARLTQG